MIQILNTDINKLTFLYLFVLFNFVLVILENFKFKYFFVYKFSVQKIKFDIYKGLRFYQHLLIIISSEGGFKLLE